MAPRARSVALSADTIRYKDFQAASAAIALGMLGGGVPTKWAPWFIVSLVGGREALVRMPPNYVNEHLENDKIPMFESWTDFINSGRALTAPIHELQSNPALLSFFIELDSMVSLR